MSGWNDGKRAKCTKCGKVMRGSEPGECFRCRSGRRRPDSGAASSKPASPRPARASKRRDADDSVLERVGLADTPADEAPPTSAVSAAPKDESWFEKFVRLHTALGLDAEGAIEDHCRTWVELTTARALGESLVELAEKKLRKRKPRAAAPSNGALSQIGDDYERARAQAETAHE